MTYSIEKLAGRSSKGVQCRKPNKSPLSFTDELTSLSTALAHCSENSLLGARVTVVVAGKRETHLSLHDRTGLHDPAAAAVPSAPVTGVPSEAQANLFPV